MAKPLPTSKIFGPSSSTTRGALSAPKYDDTTLGGHQISVICCLLQWYSLVPGNFSVFHVVSLRETKVFSCQHKTRVLERKLQNVNLPCIKTARIPRKCQNVKPFFVSTRNMPTDSFAIRKSDWNGHQAYSKWISGSYLVHCVIVPFLWMKLATSFFLSSCCSRHLALNLKLLTRRRRRRGVAEG